MWTSRCYSATTAAVGTDWLLCMFTLYFDSDIDIVLNDYWIHHIWKGVVFCECIDGHYGHVLDPVLLMVWLVDDVMLIWSYLLCIFELLFLYTYWIGWIKEERQINDRNFYMFYYSSILTIKTLHTTYWSYMFIVNLLHSTFNVTRIKKKIKKK